ncbi:hypothetical protein BDF14DRAFT_1795023 [Spinellus fusiger]|nr:hypothetical protein BDF14DRAFT_1795023 [Spinellus fusiger]
MYLNTNTRSGPRKFILSFLKPKWAEGHHPKHTISGKRLTMSPDSLQMCLQDPRLLESLRELSIQDFSVENVLFYEQYTRLQSTTKYPIFSGPMVQEPHLSLKRMKPWKNKTSHTITSNLSKSQLSLIYGHFSLNSIKSTFMTAHLSKST